MSEEQLKAFVAKVQSDTSLQEQLKAEGADPVAIAKAAGFEIKQQDLLRHASELSDEELEGVSGGTFTGYTVRAETALKNIFFV
mgnify:CR=1 FL=1